MKKQKKQKLILISTLLFTTLSFLPSVVSADVGMSCSNGADGGDLRLPFDGQWVISQGYNDPTSHKAYSITDITYALDFTANGSWNTGNLPILAPADGTVVTPGNVGITLDDMMCMDLDGILGSVEIGHFCEPSGGVPSVGTSFSKGDEIGLVVSSDTCSYVPFPPHIHMAYFPSDNCSGATVPYDDMFGGNTHLPSDGSSYQYWKSPIGCGTIPSPGIPPASGTITANPFSYNPFTDPYTHAAIEEYIMQHKIEIDTTSVTVADNPVVDNSLIGVMIRLVKHSIEYGPWLLALMIVITGFMFITSMGITTRIMKARQAFLYTIIGTTVLLSMIVIVELMEATFLSYAKIVLSYFI